MKKTALLLLLGIGLGVATYTLIPSNFEQVSDFSLDGTSLATQIVKVDVFSSNIKGLVACGSGMQIGDGIYVTADHVVDMSLEDPTGTMLGTPIFKIKLENGLSVPVTVIKTDKRRDVAILATNPASVNLKSINLDRIRDLKKNPLKVGDKTYAVAFPGLSTSLYVSRGKVADIPTDGQGTEYVLTHQTVQQGMSGGPLFDENGKLIGLCDLGYHNFQAGVSDIQNTESYFASSDEILAVIQDLVKNGPDKPIVAQSTASVNSVSTKPIIIIIPNGNNS